MAVFVLDKHKKPLMPCSEKRARLLLDRKRAVVVKIYPFTIRLKDRIGGDTQPVRIKIDPGSKHTGIALVRESEIINSITGEVKTKLNVLNLFQLDHHGQIINKRIINRKSYRRCRRTKLWHRKARFLNRTRPIGWLAPSVQHRVNSTMNWINKLRNLVPIIAISTEHAKFDTQLMQNPEISGIEYQYGELQGYEIKEYLLEKYNRTCAYCGIKKVPFEVEHIIPTSRGGSSRVSNLTLACHKCNDKKDRLTAEEFGYPEIQKQVKESLKDVAVMNATRNKLLNELIKTGLPVETGTGAQTKFNRNNLKLPKSHTLDAVCVGNLNTVENWNIPSLNIKCMGRGTYQRTLVDKYGFPRAYLTRQKLHFGFQTGDIVSAMVPIGKKTGNYSGRVSIRTSGSFDIMSRNKNIQGISYSYCKMIQRSDGYSYFIKQHKEQQSAY